LTQQVVDHRQSLAAGTQLLVTQHLLAARCRPVKLLLLARTCRTE